MAFTKAFDLAFEHTVGLEGGYVNDPDDPGGETKYGISKRSHPNVDIANLTVVGAKAIYFSSYWTPLQLDRLELHVASEVFDTAVNMGSSTATRILQKSLVYLGHDIVVDGAMGPRSIDAANKVVPASDLLKVFKALRVARYVELCEDNPTLRKFARGWLNRVEFKEAA
jgi:lysozyme family protein